MSKLSRDELLQLIPVYVLGALEDNEHSQVEALLEVDTEARAIEADYRLISAIVPLSVVSQQAPDDLKARLFQRIHDKADDVSIADTPITPQHPHKAKRKGIPRRRYVLPLVAVLAIVFVGVVLVLSNRDTVDTPYTSFRILYEQPYTEKVYVSASDQSPTGGILLISNDGADAVLRVEDVPELDDTQVFQLWLVNDYGVSSGGIYQANERSELYIVIPNKYPINRYSRFGISIEPGGGSPLGDAPSGDRVFSVNVP